MRKLPDERLTTGQARTPAKAGGQAKGLQARTPAQAGGQAKGLTPAQAVGQAEEAPARGHEPERKCILSGRHGSRDELIRLALGPDGQVAPDVRARAAGRGAWIGVDRTTLEAAQTKGKLRAALARAFKTGDIEVPADLGERIEAALRQTTLHRLGLEARSGKLIAGSDRIEDAARRGQVRFLLHAADASEEGNRRLDQAWRVGSDEEGGERRGLVFPLGRAILSLALGRENVVHVAIVDGGAAVRVRHAIDRWRAFIGRETKLGAAGAKAPGGRDLDVGEGLE